MNRNYEVILNWSNDDNAFVAEVPELPGCMAHGGTEEEARKQIEMAKGNWIETARELGRPVPNPRGERLTLGLQENPLATDSQHAPVEDGGQDFDPNGGSGPSL